MNKRKNGILAKLLAVMVAVSLCVPAGAQAAAPEPVQPQASKYIKDSSTEVRAIGGGDLEIHFTVIGSDAWADIGVLTIYLYESTDNSNFSCVQILRAADYTDMLGHNVKIYSNHVDCEGVSGRYYKAYIMAWAGTGNNGDALYRWSSAVRCT